MGQCIKWVIKIVVIIVIIGSMAYASDEIASPSARNDMAGEDIQSPKVETAEDEEMTTEGDEEEGITEEVEEDINIPEVVATVNGVNITRQDLEGELAQLRAMDPEGFDAMSLNERKMEIIRILDNMVLREVGYQDAVRRGIVVTDEDVGMGLDDMKMRFPSEEAFEKNLTDAGETIPSLKEDVRKDLMMMKLEMMVMDGVAVSDEEIADYYEKNKKDINKDSIRISHILVKTEEEAMEVIKGLEKKEDFADLAKEYSIDTFTKDKGGDAGWNSTGELLKEVDEAAFSLSPGQITPPVKSRFGYHIIRLEEKNPVSGQTIEDHREDIRYILQQEKWKDLKFSWVRLLLNEAKIWKWSPEEDDVSPSPSPDPVHRLQMAQIAQKGQGIWVEEMGAGEKEAIEIPEVVATVNEVKIMRQELERRMGQSRAMDPERFDAMGIEERKRAIMRTIDNMVFREVVYQEAVKRGIVVTEEEIGLNLDNLKKQFPSEEAFEKAFADAKMTIPAWREEQRRNLIALKLEDLMVN